jgi:hypothetical protein
LFTGIFRTGKNTVRKLFFRKHRMDSNPEEKLGYKTGG